MDNRRVDNKLSALEEFRIEGFCSVFMLIMLFIGLFKSAVSPCKKTAKIFAIAFENCLERRTG